MLRSIAEASAALDRGSVSAMELLEGSLRRLARWQPATNAFLEVTEKRARAQARRSDVRRRNSEARGPLDGVPLAYKDMFDLAGRRASYGSRIRQSVAASSTCRIIARLERAGAVTLGFLNMSEFALGPTGHNATFGHCRNPWDPERISGGSSSGAAAAVAAGTVFGAIGSDTGGSIRIPSSCCGVTGLKVSQGRIKARGALRLAPSLDCFGPVARSAGDCELLLQPLALLRGGPAQASTPLKLAFPAAAISRLADPEIVDALTKSVDVLARAGAVVLSTQLPGIEALHALADRVQAPESAVAHAERLAARRDEYTAHVRDRIEMGFTMSATSYVEALEIREMHRRQVLSDAFGDCDTLVLPTVGVPVPRIVDTDAEVIGGASELVRQMTYWTRWINYVGLPAISIPCGIDLHGLPIGMQLVGRPGGERRLLQVAKIFQSLTSWHRRVPPPPSASAGVTLPDPAFADPQDPVGTFRRNHSPRSDLNLG